MTLPHKYMLTALSAILLSFPSAKAERRIQDTVSELPEYVQKGIDKVGLNGLTEEESEYLSFLYSSMPLPDMAGYTFDYWLENVRKAIEVRRNASWEIPEREFRHFVLPVRVNNEALDNFRTEYADELCTRVKGLTLREAALEINHWCHEMVTYQPSDGRTLPPTGSIKAGLGRCGEESVLAVAALRAAGIPARQVYTPRWAHTDDNHAWVEVFVDGNWHFMGACEPEPVLDLAWFNAPVSRAMLLHTLAFGDYNGPEDVIRKTRSFTEINVIKSYIPTRRTTVKVVDGEGNAVEGAEVEFKIYNYAEFYTVARVMTGKDGLSGLDTGIGDMLVWAHKGDRFGVAKASSEMTEVTLEYKFGDSLGLDFEIVPPVENPIPSTATEAQVKRNAERLAEEDAIRAARPKGNAEVLDAFRSKHKGKTAEDLMKSLAVKDLGDVRADVLEDALKHCAKTFKPYRDCPRVSLEPLLPYFEEIGKGLKVKSAKEIFDWTLANIKVEDALNPQGIYMPPVVVWRCRMADSRSRNIFFVAACRSKGIEARIDGMTGKTQYREKGEWKDVKWVDEVAKAPSTGTVRATYEPVSWLENPLYYRHFTLSRVENGSASLLEFDDDSDGWKELLSEPCAVEEGYYLLTSAIRKADGSVSAHLELFNVAKGGQTVVPLVLKQQKGDVVVIDNIDAEPYLPVTGRGYFALVEINDMSEPSIHALRQLASTADLLNRWGRKILVFCKDKSKIESYLKGVENIVYQDYNPGSKSGPMVMIADSFGRVVYRSQGYNTSLSEQLKAIIIEL